MSNDLIAGVLSQFKTEIGYKTGIPLHTTSFFATENEAEAHYLCAIINSKPVRDFIKSFSSAGRGFGTPSVMDHIGIPRFDPSNPVHLKIAEFSIKCHELMEKKGEDEKNIPTDRIHEIEEENDRVVMQLFGIRGSYGQDV